MNQTESVALHIVREDKFSLKDQRIEKPLSPLRAVAVMVGGGVTIGCVWAAIIWIARLLWP